MELVEQSLFPGLVERRLWIGRTRVSRATTPTVRRFGAELRLAVELLLRACDVYVPR